MKTVAYVSAHSKNTVFPNDLLRRIAGKNLIQRAIAKARDFGVSDQHIFVYTDSEEISLLVERAGAIPLVDNGTTSERQSQLSWLFNHFRNIVHPTDRLLKLSPYVPLLDVGTLKKASSLLENAGVGAVVSTNIRPIRSTVESYTTMEDTLTTQNLVNSRFKSQAFVLMDGSVFKDDQMKRIGIETIDLDSDVLEINSHHDWWICEKLIKRKRVIFRVIGNETVGMGHIYRSLALARELYDHEVIFITDTESGSAVRKLVKYDYRTEIYRKSGIVEKIIEFAPDLLINDILDTNRSEVVHLRSSGMRVMNFEDLGDGAREANVTINELYDNPCLDGYNIRWGSKYYFLRDEFIDAVPCKYARHPIGILLAFGGADVHNLTRKILFTIKDICKHRGIPIYVVTGPAYKNYSDLEDEVATMEGVSLTHATGVISKLMEKVSIAITSNGRTVYEMAHMNIPAIVIPQHERERTHLFATENNGFIALEPYTKDKSETEVLAAFTRVIDNHEYRKALYKNTLRHSFSENKKRVLDLINQELEQ